MVVSILEKKEGEKWWPQEINDLVRANIELETLPKKPHRVVAMNKSLDGRTFHEVLPYASFTVGEAEYEDRWR